MITRTFPCTSHVRTSWHVPVDLGSGLAAMLQQSGPESDTSHLLLLGVSGHRLRGNLNLDLESEATGQGSKRKPACHPWEGVGK